MRTLSTVAPFGFDFDTDRFIELYRAFGCVSVQYYRNTDNEPTLQDVHATCERHGVTIDSMHGVFGAHLDPASDDPQMRASCLEVYAQEGRLSLDLGAPMVVVHPAANFAPPPDDPFNFPHLTHEEAAQREPELWPNFDDFARRLAEIGERLGVTYIFENMGLIAPLGHNAQALAQHVADVGSERIRVCFDTGHAHFTGDVYQALEAAAPVTAYLHLHDNDRVTDNHRLPGDGTIDWDTLGALFERLNLNCPCMLEAFYPLDEVAQKDAPSYASFLTRACALDNSAPAA